MLVDFEDLAGQLLDASMNSLLEKIKSGDATDKDIAVALKYIQEVGIKQVMTDETPLGQTNEVLKGMPDFTENAH